MIKSVLFRILILIFGYVIQSSCEGLVSGYLFAVVGFIYMALFAITRIKKLSIIRLLVDFIFINLVIYGRDINNPLCFLLVLLPIINAVNYSGTNNRSLLLMCLVTATFIFHLGAWESWILLPIVSLWMIFLVAHNQHKERDLQYGVTEHIDTYFTNQAEITKPHVIYQHIIEDLNSYFFYSKNKGIERIIAYSLKGNTLWLINASVFLWERCIVLKESEVDALDDGVLIKRVADGRMEIFMKIKQSEVDYVFCCELDHIYWYMLRTNNYEKILRNTYAKIALLLNADYRIQNMRNEKFDEIKDNVLYVNKAIKVMHFIRNRMTPIKNLLEYQIMSTSMPADIRRKMDKRMQKEIQQADSDLVEILSTADYLLDKSNNPFVEPELKEHHFSKIFIITSEIAQRLLDGIVEPDESIINLKSGCRDIIVATNLIETKIMLADWINNMRKYKNNYYSITVSYVDEKIVVHMENDYDYDEDTIRRLVRDINSKSKDAVIEGKDYGYGVHIIRSIAFELNVELKAEVNYKENIGSLLCLDLIFKTYERKENSDI